MSHSGSTIIAPVSILGDLQPVLGTSYKGLGQIITNANINQWSLYKPYRSSNTAQSLASRQSAKYGWNILTKQVGTTALSFINTIYGRGDQAACWTHEKPRGISSNEWFRELDFDGYNGQMKAYGEPIEYNRLSSYELNISGTDRDATIPKQQGLTLNYTSETFSLTGAFEGIIKIQTLTPTASGNHFDVEGRLDIDLRDKNGRLVGSWGDDTTIPNETAINMDFTGSLDEFEGPFHLEYRLLIDYNNSYYEDPYSPGSRQYFAVDIRIRTDYAATLTKYYRGTKGVFVGVSNIPIAWRDTTPTAESAVFGSNTHNLCIIQVSNGTTTQRKIVWANMGYIPFKKIGITIEPRVATSDDDVMVYMLKGSPNMFPNFSILNCWGDISLADNYQLQAFPYSLKKLGKMPIPPEPMVVYSDDCQGISVWMYGSSQPDISGATPTLGGLSVIKSGDCSRIRVTWDIGIDNCPDYGNLTAYLATYDGGGFNELYDQASQSVSVSASSSQTLHLDISVDCPPNTMDAVYVKLWFDLFGVRYYVKMFPQGLQDNNPGQWNIGTGAYYQD